jgi:hypothetical protein
VFYLEDSIFIIFLIKMLIEAIEEARKAVSEYLKETVLMGL